MSAHEIVVTIRDGYATLMALCNDPDGDCHYPRPSETGAPCPIHGDNECVIREHPKVDFCNDAAWCNSSECENQASEVELRIPVRVFWDGDDEPIWECTS